ncbi:hypothetical protein ACJJTC_017714 [Scirpophaga incertulas]
MHSREQREDTADNLHVHNTCVCSEANGLVAGTNFKNAKLAWLLGQESISGNGARVLLYYEKHYDIFSERSQLVCLDYTGLLSDVVRERVGDSVMDHDGNTVHMHEVANQVTTRSLSTPYDTTREELVSPHICTPNERDDKYERREPSA